MKYWPDRSSSATHFAFLRDPEQRERVVGNMQKLFRVRSSPHGKIDWDSGKRRDT
jgi:hypothetical protein